MNWIRPAVLTALVLLVGAAPAQATLLIRSDGNGFLLQDTNGLNDDVRIGPDTMDGRTAYRISNGNPLDIFAFGVSTGCRQVNPIGATCFRNGPAFSVLLVGGADILDMHDAPIGESAISGGSGDDKLKGHEGKDVIAGGPGEDELKGLAGGDTLDGAENADRLEGGSGNDTLEGEDGADVLFGGLGADILRGNPGNDFIDSKEPEGTTAVADEIGCGGNTDTLVADLKDVVPASCENVEQSPVGETPNVTILGEALRVSPTGEVKAGLRCPRGVKKLGCNGTLQLGIARSASRGAQSSRSRKVAYEINAGKHKLVTLQLTDKDVARLRRRQDQGKRTRGILTSVEKGKIGRKTTIRQARLKLR
jgi:hypothetical protein